jgi:AcrR family transcriptional regulator
LARQEERRLRTRAAILDAAEQLFGENGFDATTVDTVAQTAAVAKGAVYHHFKDKADLFEAVFENVAARLAGAVAESIGPAQGGLDGLMASTRTFFSQCSDPHIMRIVLKDAPAALGYDRWKEIDARHFSGLVAFGLASAMEAGAIQKQPIEPLSRIMLAAIQSAALDCAAAEDFDSTAETYLGTLETLLRGLARP